MSNEDGPESVLFVKNVDKYCKTKGGPEKASQTLHGMLSNYKLLEQRLTSQKSSMETRIVDINAALDSIEHLTEKKEDAVINTQFQLSTDIYAKAKIEKPENVVLWLGANVMVEYPLNEAAALLNTHLDNTQQQLVKIQASLDKITNKITTAEVLQSRIKIMVKDKIAKEQIAATKKK